MNIFDLIGLLVAFGALAFLWNVAPFLVLLTLPVSIRVKLRCAKSLLTAIPKGFASMLPDLLAPLVVPFALLSTPRSADRLPAWAWWWNNDVSINGDREEYWDPEYKGGTYYAGPFHPRSFIARWVWLGLRNRASALSLALGHAYAPGEYADAEHWGDPRVGRDHEGWTINRRGPAWQLYVVKRLGARLCFRMNYGYKVWAGEGDKRPVAMVVNIGASVLRWRGEA